MQSDREKKTSAEIVCSLSACHDDDDDDAMCIPFRACCLFPMHSINAIFRNHENIVNNLHSVNKSNLRLHRQIAKACCSILDSQSRTMLHERGYKSLQLTAKFPESWYCNLLQACELLQQIWLEMHSGFGPNNISPNILQTLCGAIAFLCDAPTSVMRP